MIEQLIHRVKIRQSELQMALINGTVATWDGYQRVIGEYRGLQATLDMIDNMLEEEKNSD